MQSRFRLFRPYLVETTTEDFLNILKAGTSTTNHYLRRLHNLALGLGWILSPGLSAKQWQPVQMAAKASHHDESKFRKVRRSAKGGFRHGNFPSNSQVSVCPIPL